MTVRSHFPTDRGPPGRDREEGWLEEERGRKGEKQRRANVNFFLGYVLLKNKTKGIFRLAY